MGPRFSNCPFTALSRGPTSALFLRSQPDFPVRTWAVFNRGDELTELSSSGTAVWLPPPPFCFAAVLCCKKPFPLPRPIPYPSSGLRAWDSGLAGRRKTGDSNPEGMEVGSKGLPGSDRSALWVLWPPGLLDLVVMAGKMERRREGPRLTVQLGPRLWLGEGTWVGAWGGLLNLTVNSDLTVGG